MIFGPGGGLYMEYSRGGGRRSTRKGGGGIIIGDLLIAFYVSLGLIPKAVVEAAYFHDRPAAKETLKFWIVSVGSVLSAGALSLLIYYFS